GRNAVQPSLVRKLFVRRKIEPHQQANSPVGHCQRLFRGGRARFSRGCFTLALFRSFSFGFLRRRRVCFRFGFGLAHSFDTRAVGTGQLVLQFFVASQSLPLAV